MQKIKYLIYVLIFSLSMPVCAVRNGQSNRSMFFGIVNNARKAIDAKNNEIQALNNQVAALNRLEKTNQDFLTASKDYIQSLNNTNAAANKVIAEQKSMLESYETIKNGLKQQLKNMTKDRDQWYRLTGGLILLICAIGVIHIIETRSQEYKNKKKKNQEVEAQKDDNTIIKS